MKVEIACSITASETVRVLILALSWHVDCTYGHGATPEIDNLRVEFISAGRGFPRSRACANQLYLPLCPVGAAFTRFHNALRSIAANPTAQVLTAAGSSRYVHCTP